MSDRLLSRTVILLLPCITGACRFTASDPTPPAAESWTEGEYLLQLRPGTDPNELDDLLEQVQGELIRRYDLVPGLVHFRSALAPDRVLKLEANPRVESIRLNRRLRVTAEPASH